jgi:hypothetical protein
MRSLTGDFAGSTSLVILFIHGDVVGQFTGAKLAEQINGFICTKLMRFQ